jgi:hypothetical protein
MNSLWDIRIFLGLVPKESPCISSLFKIFLFIFFQLQVNSDVMHDVIQNYRAFGSIHWHNLLFWT